MPTEAERLATLEAYRLSDKGILDRLVQAVEDYVREGQESRKEHARQHEAERGQQSEDHRRIHERIDMVPEAIRLAVAAAVAPATADAAEALTIAQKAAQTVHDARIFLSGGKAALMAVGAALGIIIKYGIEWIRSGPPTPHVGP